jgi:hypothetical protein
MRLHPDVRDYVDYLFFMKNVGHLTGFRVWLYNPIEITGTLYEASKFTGKMITINLLEMLDEKPV